MHLPGGMPMMPLMQHTSMWQNPQFTMSQRQQVLAHPQHAPQQEHHSFDRHPHVQPHPHPGRQQLLAIGEDRGPDPSIHDLDNDDHTKLSTSYRSIGCIFKFGARATLPKKRRMSCLVRMDPDQWTIFRMARLEEAEIDCLVYAVTGVHPMTKLSDLNCKTKGQFRNMMAKEGHRVQRAQP